MNCKVSAALSLLCFVAAGTMYVIGSENGHLTELKDFFWAPLPLGVALGALAFKKKKSGE